MSTSDISSQKTWQPWQPENLLGEPVLSVASLHTVSDGEGTNSEALLQAELSRLRQQAEKKGFEQGQVHGVEEGKKVGYEDGRILGIEEGRAAGKEEMHAQLEELRTRQETLLKNMQAALDNLDSIIPSRLVQLSLSAARSLFGKKIVNDSVNEMLQERIHNLLQDDPLFQQNTQLWVSEEDMEFVSSLFSQTLATRGWKLVADKKMHQGGCRITSDEGEIDESIETRWKMICTQSWEESQQ